MDKITAIRSFGAASFKPCAARVRIRDDRWYLVTLQNVETDPRCDYVGLADGERAFLLPGTAARERRDARLNRCNRIVEYNGEVWEAVQFPFGRPRAASYHTNRDDAEDQGRILEDERQRHLAALKQEAEKYGRIARGEVAARILSRQECAGIQRDCLMQIVQSQPWDCKVKRIR